MAWLKTNRRRYSHAFPAMGTVVRVELYAASDEQAREGIHAVERRFAALNACLSDYAPDSELNQFCRAGFRREVRLSSDLFTILVFSQRLALLSGGAFDVTIGGRTRGRQGPVGYQHLALGNGTGRLLREGMQLDLGGVAKGYAAEEASKELRRLGMPRHLVAASGDVFVWDAPPNARGWRVGLGGAQNARELRRCAVSTSGETYQPGHIVDARDQPAPKREGTLTVLARHGMEADALATALWLLEPSAHADLLRSYPGAKLSIAA
jgi:thiamine biosynthesis lipoprotein